MKRALIAALPAVLALGLVACGDDDDRRHRRARLAHHRPPSRDTDARRGGEATPARRRHDPRDHRCRRLTLPGGITIPDLGRSCSIPDLSDLSIPDLRGISLPTGERSSRSCGRRSRTSRDDQIDCLVDELGGELDPQRLPDIDRDRARSSRRPHPAADGPLRRRLARCRRRARAAGSRGARAPAGVLRRHDRRRPPPPRPLRGDGGEVGPGRRGARLARVRPGLRGLGRRRVRRRRGGRHRARPHPHRAAVAVADPREPQGARRAGRRRDAARRGVQRVGADRGRCCDGPACARSAPAPAPPCAA